MMMEKHFLLTAGRSYLTLDWARLLSAQGHRVTVVDTSKRYLCRYSNAVHNSYTLPSPKKHPQAFINALVNICKTQHVDYCLPMFEEALWLAPYRQQLLPHCELLCPDLDTLVPLHNKWQFNQWLLQQGLTAPQSQLVTQPSQLENLDPNQRYILKKVYTHASQSVYLIDHDHALPPHLEFTPDNPWVLQAFVEGKKFCGYGIARQGRLQAASIYPLSFAIDSNSCVFFESIDKPNIIEWMKQVTQAFNYTGQIAFDFIEDSQGDLYPIECNPRGTSGIHLFSPKQALDQALTSTIPHCITPPTGQCKQILMGMLLYGHRTPQHERRGRRYWHTLRHTADIIYHRQDPHPAWMQPMLSIHHLLEAWKNDLTLTAAFYDDLVWTGYKRSVNKTVAPLSDPHQSLIETIDIQ